MSSDLQRQTHDLLEAAQEAGFRVIKGGSHYRVFAPDGQALTATPATPSCKRGVLNFRAWLRRHGLPRQ
jgi:hypothetical protein